MDVNKFYDLVYDAAVDECHYLSDVVPSIYYIDSITNKLGYYKIPNQYLTNDEDIFKLMKLFISDFIETHGDVEYYSILIMSNEFRIDISDKDIDDLIDDEGVFDMDILANNADSMQRIINICDYGKLKHYPQTRRIFVDKDDVVINNEIIDFSILD